MALLGGSKKGRPAAPQARDIRARVQGNGQVNLEKLKSLKERHASRGDFYKLQQNGTSRFRIVLPLGHDDVPMAIADQHFLPVIDDTGKKSKRSVYCMNSFGLDCPICRLTAMLQNSNDAGLIEDGNEIRCASRWAMWVVNRDYLAEADDPMAEFDPKKDKIAMLSVPKGIGEDIIEYMQKRVWADPQDPENGYDFEVVGKKKGGSSPWPEYTLTPQPRDSSPAYDTNLLKGVKPLSQVIVPAKIEDLDKILTPILMSLAESGDDGAYIVEEFSELWNDFKEVNKNGIIIPESVRDADPDIDNAGSEEDDEAYVEETAAAPAKHISRPVAKPAAKPAAPTAKRRAVTPPPEEEEEFDGDGAQGFEDGMTEGEDDDGETQEGTDFAPEGGDAEGEGYGSDETTGEDEGDTEPPEEEPKQPVRRPAAPRPVAKPAAAPVAKPAAPRPAPAPTKPAVARPAPAAPANSMKNRLAGIGKK